MNAETLKHRLEKEVAVRLTRRTLEIWAFCYTYIYEHGFADVRDSAFVRAAARQFHCSTHGLMRHLLRMHKTGLLAQHILHAKPHPVAQVLLGPQFGEYDPTRFARYTLPGMAPHSVFSVPAKSVYGEQHMTHRNMYGTHFEVGEHYAA
jgi:hypothetical protein